MHKSLESSAFTRFKITLYYVAKFDLEFSFLTYVEILSTFQVALNKGMIKTQKYPITNSNFLAGLLNGVLM